MILDFVFQDDVLDFIEEMMVDVVTFGRLVADRDGGVVTAAAQTAQAVSSGAVTSGAVASRAVTSGGEASRAVTSDDNVGRCWSRIAVSHRWFGGYDTHYSSQYQLEQLNKYILKVEFTTKVVTIRANYLRMHVDIM